MAIGLSDVRGYERNGDYIVVRRYFYTVWGTTPDCSCAETCYVSTGLDYKEDVLYDCKHHYQNKGEDFIPTDCVFDDLKIDVINKITGDTSHHDIDFKDISDIRKKWEDDNN